MSLRAEGLAAVEARHSRRTLPGRGGGGGRSSATPSRRSRASGCLAASGGGGVLVVARPAALWLGRGGAGAAGHQAPRQPAPSSPPASAATLLPEHASCGPWLMASRRPWAVGRPPWAAMGRHDWLLIKELAVIGAASARHRPPPSSPASAASGPSPPRSPPAPHAARERHQRLDSLFMVVGTDCLERGAGRSEEHGAWRGGGPLDLEI